MLCSNGSCGRHYQLIKRPDTLVRGTIDVNALSGGDIGVTVNGVVAHVYGNTFAANHVPLTQGNNNTITAIAISADDYMAKDNVTVSADTTGGSITLSSNLESGIVSEITPLDFTLKLARTYDNGTYSFSYDGPGAVENLGDNSTSLQFMRRITDPGLYYITAEDNETVDNVTKVLHSDTIAIMAETRDALDTKLRGKWGGMQSDIVNQNYSKAIKIISEASKELYRDMYSELAAELPGVVTSMSPPELVFTRGGYAKYRSTRTQNINGKSVTITYYIYFVQDSDGLWRIESW